MKQGRWFLVWLVVLLSACSTDPERKKATYMAGGERFFAKGDYHAARIELLNALKLDPKFERAHYRLAETCLKLGDLRCAHGALRATVQLNPKNSGAQLQLAGLLLAARQYTEAKALAEKLIAADGKNAAAHSMLGGIHAATGDVPNAIREFQTVIELEPQRAERYLNLGAVYVSASRPAEALDVYRKAIQVDPKSSLAHAALGRFHFTQGKAAEAEAEIRKAIELDTRSVDPRISLAALLRATGRVGEAEKGFAELKTVAPDDPQAYRALGLFYLSRNEKQKAIGEFRVLLRSKPKDNPVKAFLIEALLDTQQIDEAEALNRELQKSDMKNPSALFAGRIYLARGKYQDALTELQSAVTAAPQSAMAHYYLGVAQNAAGFPLQARPSWSRALELQPGLNEPRIALAELELRNRNHEQALRLAGDALKANPNLASGHYVHARALIAEGETKQAQSALETALQRDPVFVPALRLWGGFRINEGKSAEFLQRLLTLVALHPQNADLRSMLAALHLRLKNLPEAEASAREALKLGGAGSEASTILAQVHVAQGSISKAKQVLEAGIAANPRSATNCLALAALFEEESNWEQAKKLYEKAHQIDPKSPLAANNLAYFYLEHGGDVQQALSLAQAANRGMPGSPQTADTLGWAYYKSGSHDLAITHLKTCTEKAPENYTYRYHLGMAYMAAGYSESAMESLRRAIAGNPNARFVPSARAALAKISGNGN